MKKLICIVLAALLLTACGANPSTDPSAADITAQIMGEEVRFAPWVGEDLPTEGSYYLTRDLELAETVKLTGDLELHLNGHAIIAAHGQIIGNLFHIPADMTMTVYDAPAQEDFFARFDPELDSEEEQEVTITGGTIASSRSFSGKVTVSSMFKVEGKLVIAGGHIDASQIHLENRANGIVANVTGSMEVCGGVITGGTTWRFLPKEEPAETTPATTAPAETTPAETTPAETTPVETAPVETTPVETTPVETEPVEEIIPGDMGLGGGIYVAPGATCRISGGTLWGGSAYQGGNVYVEKEGRLEISGGRLLGGAATKGGGNACIMGTLEMTGGSMDWGDSYGDGGNLFVSGNLNMTGGELLGGEADANAMGYKYGGNLAVDGIDAVIKITNSRIIDGTAACKESHGGNISVIRYGAKEFEVGEGTYIYGGLGHRGGNVYIGHFAKDIPLENTDYVFTKVEMNGGDTTYRGANMCSDTKNKERPVQVTFNDCVMGVEIASQLSLAIGAGAADNTCCIITINGGTFTGGGLSLYGNSSTTANGVTFVDCPVGGTGEFIENP